VRCLVLLALLLATPVLGQEQTPLLEPGEYVRVHLVALDAPIIGTWQGIDERGLIHVESDDPSNPRFFSANSVHRLEVRGERQNIVGGLVIGGALGAASGALGGLMVYGVAGGTTAIACGVAAFDEFSDVRCESPDASGYVVPGAAIGLALGAGIGALIGAAHRTGWVAVDLPTAKPIVAIHPTGRFSVGFTIPVGR
jgi:hypothetical protein